MADINSRHKGGPVRSIDRRDIIVNEGVDVGRYPVTQEWKPVPDIKVGVACAGRESRIEAHVSSAAGARCRLPEGSKRKRLEAFSGKDGAARKSELEVLGG